jgi:hypothetical protein
MKKILKTSVALLCCLAAAPALAFENDSAPYPVGTTSIGIASLPPIPGVFLLDQTDVAGAGYLTDSHGNKKEIPPFKVHSVSTTPRILISWPVTLPGNGRLYTQIVPPIVFLNTEVFGQKFHTAGVANFTITPFLGQWSVTRNFKIASGFDFILPTGAYSASKPAIASGYTTYSPVLSLRYNNPRGLDIGVSNRLFFNATNTRTNYHSGDAYMADYIAGWNIGHVELGVTGGWLQEYQRDSQYGAAISGSRQEIFRIGPSITYSGRFLGKIPFIVNVNDQFDVISKNAPKENNFWVNIGFPLFAPPPPAPPVQSS